QRVAVVRTTLAGERLDAQKVLACAREPVNQQRVGGPAEDPYGLVVVRNPVQPPRVEPTPGTLVNGNCWIEVGYGGRAARGRNLRESGNDLERYHLTGICMERVVIRLAAVGEFSGVCRG